MDRFLDENKIIKKSNTSNNVPQHIIQKARILKNNVQEKLNTLTPEQKNQLIDNNISTSSINANDLLQNMAENINLVDNIYQNNISKQNLNNTNIEKEQSLNINDSSSIINSQQSYITTAIDNSSQNILQEENNNINFNTSQQNNSMLKENEMISINNATQNNINHEEVNNKNKYMSEIQAIQNSALHNNIQQIYQQQDTIEIKNKNGEKKMTSKDMLLQKKNEAFNKLLDYQIEFEICSKMSMLVEEKLKTSYRTRLKDYQSKIAEQEQRLKVIKQLLNGQ